MSGIVLRCPNCGTVQPTGGECEACREAQIRYFCTNHTPGLWLDSASCAKCGARFGDTAPARATPPAPTSRTDYPPPRGRESAPDMRGSHPDLGPWGGGAPAEDPSLGDSRGARPDPTRLLLAIFSAAARARGSRSAPSDYEDDAPPRRRGGGCMGRLLMLALLLIGLFLIVPILLGALLGFG